VFKFFEEESSLILFNKFCDFCHSIFSLESKNHKTLRITFQKINNKKFYFFLDPESSSG